MPASNFDFLTTNPRFAAFAGAAVAAERILAVDAGASALACRRALEFAVKWLYSVDKSLPMPEQEQLVALMNVPEFRALLDDTDIALWRRLDYIRKLGNTAAHSGAGVSREMAMLALRHLHDFLDFLACCYDRNYRATRFDPALLDAQPEPAPAPDPPAPGPDLAALVAENAALREELTALRQEQQARYNPPPEPTEFATRKAYIDAMLLDAGWTPGKDWQNEVALDGMPSKSGQGFADYVLYGEDGRPLAVVEAKRTCVQPTAGREQAKLYADILEKRHGRRPVIFLSNGFETYIDDGFYPERRVAAVFSKRDLEKLFNLRTLRADLADASASEAIAGRYYQQAAVKAVCESLSQRRREALLVMATGSGKTRTVIALCDALLRRGWVKNILFLADRNALVTQAKRAFANLLPNLSATNLCEDRSNPGAHAVFSTYQTMMARIDNAADEEGPLFTCGHFDLVILDEAHRSIYNKYRDILGWFDAPLIGLTATPKDEIDRNTYELFNLPEGSPTYGYELAQAVRDGFLVSFTAIETKLKFLEEGIAYDELTEAEKAEYENTFVDEHGAIPERIGASALNTWLFNADTIRLVLHQLMEQGLKVDYGERIGKTIIFAKNHDHAEKILEVFNKDYPHLPGRAQVIDNYTSYAQSVIDRFSEPESLPQIAISVDMLDTGIDVPEILNLVFFKKVFSRAKFWQMIGRGTRLCPGLLDGADKTGFYIFDFCGNFAFFRLNEGAGREIPAPTTLQAALFLLKAQIVFKLQDLAFQTDALRAFRAALVEELLNKARALDRGNFAVRQHLEQVERFSREETYAALAPEDLPLLRDELAPLVLPDAGEPEALRFDALLYGVELAHIAGERHAAGWRDVQRRARALMEVASIPEVAAQKALLERAARGGYPETADAGAALADFEAIRKGLRELMKYLPKNRRRYDTNFGDNILDIQWTTGEPEDGGLASYRERAEAYIRNHQDNPAIAKLKGNQPLSGDDIRELERILWTELGSRADYERAFGAKPLGEFVRGIVGLDMNAAKAAFARFLNDASLDSRQIWFVNRIVEYIVQNGMMKDLSVLMDPPFNAQGGVSDIFGDLRILAGIREAIDEVNGNMAAV